MKLNLPKSPNPHAGDDLAEGRLMASNAAHWLEELDAVLTETQWTDDGARSALRDTAASWQGF
jgi:hypothetical protein